MASSYTTRKRLNRQATGDNVSTWGTVLNGGALDVVDFAMDGWSVIALSADHSLTSADGTTTGNEAGGRVLKLTTATATWVTTLPARESWYIVWNATTAAQTIASSGGGTSVSIAPGEVVFVATDAVNVKRLTLSTQTTALDLGGNKVTSLGAPTVNTDAATKKYVDDTAFNSAALPGQTGNAGKVVTTDGTTASWGWAVTAAAGLATISDDTLTVAAAGAAELRGGSDDTKAATAAGMSASLAEVTLTNSGTNIITSGDAAPNHTKFINAYVLLGGAWTLPNLLNPKIGEQGRIRVQQDATGGRTLAYGGNWKPEGGLLPVMPTAANAIAFIDFEVITSTYTRFRMTSM